MTGSALAPKTDSVMAFWVVTMMMDEASQLLESGFAEWIDSFNHFVIDAITISAITIITRYSQYGACGHAGLAYSHMAKKIMA